MDFKSFSIGDVVYLDFKGEYKPKGDEAICLIRGIRECATCTQMVFESAYLGGWIFTIVREYEPNLIVYLSHNQEEEIHVLLYTKKCQPLFSKEWKESSDWYMGEAFVQGKGIEGFLKE